MVKTNPLHLISALVPTSSANTTVLSMLAKMYSSLDACSQNSSIPMTFSFIIFVTSENEDGLRASAITFFCLFFSDCIWFPITLLNFLTPFADWISIPFLNNDLLIVEASSLFRKV